MTNAELKSALITGVPVVLERPGEIPIEYARVSAIIYKREPDLWALEKGCASPTNTPGIVLLAELHCGAARSVTVADPAWERFK